MKTKITTIFLLVTILCACGSTKRVFYNSEKLLETDGETTMQLHQAAYLPNSVQLNYPGFVVGLEKSPRNKINDSEIHQLNPDAGEGIEEDIERLEDDSKLHFVSQIYDYTNESQPCVIHSVYEDLEAYSFYQRCKNAKELDLKNKENNSCDLINNPQSCLKKTYQRGWDALDTLKDSLDDEISNQIEGKEYTHAFVIVMGWNTPQLEAYRNFNDIVGDLEKVYQDQEFRPLVIGVTWASFWENSWFDPIVKLFSYGNKANDADEVGLTWLGVVLKDTIQPLRDKGIKTTLIGHSFGARAASMAVCIGPLIEKEKGGTYQPPHQWVDNFVGLQGAFSINRFFSFDDDDWFNESIAYPQGCPGSKVSLFTASKGDEAVDTQIIADMIGDDEVYTESKQDSRVSQDFHFIEVNEYGKFLQPIDKSKINYVEATNLISHNMINTGGGSHSDIYRKEISCMIKGLLEGKQDCGLEDTESTEDADEPE